MIDLASCAGNNGFSCQHLAAAKFPAELAIFAEFAGTHGLPSGSVDVVLLARKKSAVKLVLVETKVSSAVDANSKVIGQLLMYFAGALMLGSDGVDDDEGIRLQGTRTGT